MREHLLNDNDVNYFLVLNVINDMTEIGILSDKQCKNLNDELVKELCPIIEDINISN